MKSAFILDIVRTPVGKYGGSLSSIRPDDLVAETISKLLKRNPAIDPASIEDVILGAANQAGEDNRNVARMAALLAGLPVSVPGVTVNRLCASGLEAIIQAAQGIQTGNGSVFVAGGVESMSRAPFVLAKPATAFARNPEMFDTTMGWRFVNSRLASMYQPFSMGETAENVAERHGIAREEQDRFALRSQQRYAAARAAGKFQAELISVQRVERGQSTYIDADEHPRETTLEKLSSLKPAFRENGTVTAGNSSGINDGAAACLVVSEDMLSEPGIQPMVRVVGHAVAGVDPALMGMGPVPAVEKLLTRTGVKVGDIGLFELNEAFAAQSIACIRSLGLDENIVNVNGGSIAIGHPLGCSGVRISATLIHEMKRRKIRYGIATMCVGVGQGAAVLYELC
jgi:acetyl-CoA C-acetyltransferase